MTGGGSPHKISNVFWLVEKNSSTAYFMDLTLYRVYDYDITCENGVHDKAKILKTWFVDKHFKENIKCSLLKHDCRED